MKLSDELIICSVVVPILYVCYVFKETNLKTVEAYMEVPALLFLDWGVKLPLETRALEDLTVFPKVLDMFYFCLPLLLDFLQIVLIGNLSCEFVHFMNFFKIPKGQLISKCLLGVIISTKIPTKKFDNFCPSS